MTLQIYLARLPTEHLKILHDDLVEAGIAFDCKGDWRAIFARRRKAASGGGRKKIYAALTKAKRPDINRMIDTLVVMLPDGIKSQ